MFSARSTHGNMRSGCTQAACSVQLEKSIAEENTGCKTLARGYREILNN